MSRRLVDIRGKRFGRLIVIKRDLNPLGYGVYWITQCDCGGEKSVHGYSLTHGLTRSCGCLRREVGQRNIRTNRRNSGHPLRSLLRIYKYQADRKKLVWTLTDEEFFALVIRDCHYCSSPPAFTPWVQFENIKIAANGVDRMDNEKGYISENSVPCCKVCNRAKLTMDYESFIRFLENLCRNNGGVYQRKNLIS